MTETPEPSIYEKTFAKSDKTDAVLVVGGKKLHVNKAILCYHSDYFNSLFNLESRKSKLFPEDSVEEITIEENVRFEDFATVLSFVHQNPIIPKDGQIVRLLDLAQGLQLPAATKHLEMYLITSKEDRNEINTTLIFMADKFELDTLLEQELEFFKKKNAPLYDAYLGELSDKTKLRIFNSQVASPCTIL